MHQRQESRCFPCIHTLWWTTGDHLLCNVVPFAICDFSPEYCSFCLPGSPHRSSCASKCFHFILIGRVFRCINYIGWTRAKLILALYQKWSKEVISIQAII